MNEQVTRQILWNIPVAFVVIMYALLAVLGVAFVYAGMYWYRRITLGTSEDRFDQLIRRTLLAARDALGQGFVVRERWGWMHYSFYTAFIGLIIGTTIVLINSDVRELLGFFGLHLYFYYGGFYLLLQSLHGHLLPDVDRRRAGGRRAALPGQAPAAGLATGRQDARQPRELSGLLVSAADAGAGRNHRADA